jgi:hypothetical protein
MRIAATLLCAALTVSAARSEPLSAADREALIESLENLRASANERVDARFRAAINAYRPAMASNEAAIDFFLKCEEKVNYEDQNKKTSEFREWKRREADLLSDASFRLALRYQLRWLILTLRASSEDADMNAIAVDAQEIVDAVFQDVTKLGTQAQILRQPVTATVFAKAYEIGSLQKEGWPLSPLQLDQIYDKVIFPILRMPSRLESLRGAWIKRIQQEGIAAENWSGDGRGRRGGNGVSAEQRAVNSGRFATETLPELQWNMEMDLFRSGDESGAAKRMLAHIHNHITHKSARDWSEQFTTLLSPPAPTPSTALVEPPLEN